MNNKLKCLLSEIKRLGFGVQQEDGTLYLISDFSPCGQDCNAYIDTGGSANSFIQNIFDYANDLDISYETYLWLDDDGHGKNGAPWDMKDIYEDMEWWQNSLLDLSQNLTAFLQKLKPLKSK